MKLHILLPFLLLSTFSQARADLVFQILETGGNVRIQYSGTLDMSGLSFTAGNALDERSIRRVTPSGGNVQPYTALLNLYTGPFRVYANPFSSGPVAYLTSTHLASAYGGTGIHLPTLSTAQNATLRLYAEDFSGDVWHGSGFLQWNNTTLAGMGLDPAPKTWVLNNSSADTITMTVAPEPGSAILLAAGLGLFLYRSRRKTRSA